MGNTPGGMPGPGGQGQGAGKEKKDGDDKKKKHEAKHQTNDTKRKNEMYTL